MYSYSRFFIGLTLALLSQPSLAIAESKIDYSVDLIGSYSEADKQIKVNNKFSSFRAGGAGLRVEAEHDDYGLVYGSLGFGYSPKETATYSGSSLSGPANSVFYGVGYSYDYDLSHRYKLIFTTDYVAHDISADVTGQARGLPATAKVTSDMSMLDTALALRYSFTRDVHMVVGTGVRKWNLAALAEGTLGDSIGASTSVSANGSDPLSYIGVEFKVKNLPVKAYYRRSQLNADNSLTVHGLDIHISLSGLFN
jgi:hypothetical protein